MIVFYFYELVTFKKDEQLEGLNEEEIFKVIRSCVSVCYVNNCNVIINVKSALIVLVWFYYKNNFKLEI